MNTTKYALMGAVWMGLVFTSMYLYLHPVVLLWVLKACFTIIIFGMTLLLVVALLFETGVLAAKIKYRANVKEQSIVHASRVVFRGVKISLKK